ncbi:hypothetical protein [Deinococcus peraridilitoris]|uniref:Uncharacterized protein n=1 Tax=Deinococcus peraridilitoris (strain DSM 19664 / LMG 22246 / CIP 109416 / KR-200) TaxID=937777 RepID=L0A2L9_DEIPD|nr:hypothetical protein [Deinococcus peraridilitoris]AFZ67260.1 hypothetical protein Deipe_1741 [Deinococcus peraridilitoris DSM 19664]
MINLKQLKIGREQRSVRQTVKGAAGTVAGTVQEALGALAGNLQGVVTTAASAAVPVAGSVASLASGAISQGASTVQDWQHGGQRLLSDGLQSVRSAKKDALREARMAQKTAELAERRADLQAVRMLARHERKLRQLDARVSRLVRHTGSRGSGRTWWLTAVLGGGYYLARHPQARERVLDFVGNYSPATRERLHQAGQRASQLMGQVWIEREATPSPLVQQAQQAGRDASSGIENTTRDMKIATQDVASVGRDLPRDTGRSLKG